MAANFFQIETRAGDPIPAGDITIVPLAKSYQVRFPGGRGGVIWNRPASVVVHTARGQEYLLPIRDITRQTQLAIFAASLAGVLLLGMLSIRKRITTKRKENES